MVFNSNENNTYLIVLYSYTPKQNAYKNQTWGQFHSVNSISTSNLSNSIPNFLIQIPFLEPI